MIPRAAENKVSEAGLTLGQRGFPSTSGHVNCFYPTRRESTEDNWCQFSSASFSSIDGLNCVAEWFVFCFCFFWGGWGCSMTWGQMLHVCMIEKMVCGGYGYVIPDVKKAPRRQSINVQTSLILVSTCIRTRSSLQKYTCISEIKSGYVGLLQNSSGIDR